MVMGFGWAIEVLAVEGSPRRQRGDDVTYPIGLSLLWQRILLRWCWAGPFWRRKDEIGEKGLLRRRVN